MNAIFIKRAGNDAAESKRIAAKAIADHQMAVDAGEK